MEPIKTKLARIAQRFPQEREDIQKLKELSDSINPETDEIHSLHYVMKAFISFGEMEWNAAKTMKNTKARLACVQRSRIWFDAARFTNRRIEECLEQQKTSFPFCF